VAIARLAQRHRDQLRLTFRPIRMAEFAREADHRRDLYVSAWERNWGFVAPTREEFQHTPRR